MNRRGATVIPREKIMAIEKVFVIGAGTMGHGIAQVCAANGLTVHLHDVSRALIDKGIAGVAKALARVVEKGRMTAADRDALLARIVPADTTDPAREADLVIEAATETLAIKKKIFADMDALARPGVILATNTSSQSVTDIAAATKRADRVIGMHFFNPVPVMKLIEIVRGLATSDETFRTIHDLSKALGKEPVEVKDYPGFVSNRVLMIMINEAVFTLHEGVATAEDIDTVMKLGMNHPMGPLALADLIGLDVCLFILERLYTGFADPKFRPCPLLRNMVAAGFLGRKTGRGFFRYE
jgi:3-hydroxybutyryl-CoA dehydrogenase